MGFAGVVTGVEGAEVGAGFAAAAGRTVDACAAPADFVSDCTEPDLVDSAPPVAAVLSADGFESPSGVGGKGDLVSSGMSVT